MKTLLVGFDSAWTAANSGAIVAVLRSGGRFEELGEPAVVDYAEAENRILGWQKEHAPSATLVLLDQPTIVTSSTGQRPVENIVCSSVSLRYGGMQPANTGRREMFGSEAPVWRFLARFGGAADPLMPIRQGGVFETYPVLTLIALGWTQPCSRASGRLPKYNPQRRKTFSLADWKWLCSATATLFYERGLTVVAQWIDQVGQKGLPRKSDQDGLDACLCLVAALELAEEKRGLMVGNLECGYIVVPYNETLHAELDVRCMKTGRIPSEWIRGFKLQIA